MHGFRPGLPPKGNDGHLWRDSLLALTRKFQFGWFEGCMGEGGVETAVRLGAKPWRAEGGGGA